MEAQDNRGLVDMYKAKTHKAEVAIANIVASAPMGLKVMELASILGKTVVPHGSDFSATFGVGRLTEFLEGNDCFYLDGNCPKNIRTVNLTPKGQTLEVTVFPWPPKLRRDPVPPQHLIPAHHPALKPGQGLPPGVPDPKFVRVGERAQSAGPDPLGRLDQEIHRDVELECDLTDFIGRAPQQRVALDRALEDHVRQSGLMPQAMSLRSWLTERPAVFVVDGQYVSLTQQSIEHDKHLEAQFVAFLQQLARPAGIAKDIGPFCKKNNIEMRSQARMVSWFKAKHKLFNVNSAGMITLKFALRTPRPTQSEVPAPPGFAPGRKPGHNWPGPPPSHNATDPRLALLEDKIIKWLSKRHQVTTTEMAEFAYSAHEDLVPDNWDANTFCQARAQLFILTGFLHDQVELTETARGFVGSTAHSVVSSPRGHYNAAQIPQPPAGRPIANTVRQEPHSQEQTDMQQENAALKQHCLRLETEVRALRKDMVALQRHVHMPISVSTLDLDDDKPYHKLQMCVLGGHNGSAWLETVTTHRPHVKGWGRLPNLDGPRSFAAADTWNRNVFVMGGGDGNVWFNSVLRCDTTQAHPSWVSVAPMHTERGSLAVTTLGDYMYACGGGKPTAQFETVERYDPHTNRWMPQAPMHSARFALSAACVNNALYAVGGFDGVAYLNTVEQYDPRVGRWSKLNAEMLYARGSLGVVAVDDSLYAIGGFDAESALNVVEVLDTRAMQWRSLNSLNTERSYGGATVAAGQVYAVGGLQADTISYSPFLEVYDAVQDKWTIPRLPADIEPRAFAAVCSL